MYCTVQDIEAYYLGKTFDCDDYVKSSEVTSFIIQEAAFIDSFLRSKYSLPITNTTDLLLLKQINEKLVVGTIDHIFRERQIGANTKNFNRGRDTRKEAKDLLDKLISGDIVLNSTEDTSPIKFNTTDSEGNTVEKRFKDQNIEPTFETQDRERKEVIRYT